jgi:hypothetical protein
MSWGGLSFIPLLGVLFGIITIVLGLVSPKRGGKLVAAIGAGGICFTVILYGALFYFGFVQRGGVYDDLRAQMAQANLNTLVPSIEFYKIQHGQYPESLAVLQQSLPKNGATYVTVFDPTDVHIGRQPRYFYYERVGQDHYFLRGVGPDGQPFTADDIVPQVSSTPGSKVGLLLERQSN